MRTFVLLGVMLAAFAFVSPIAQKALSISLAVVFALLLFLSILSDLSDLSYRQEPDDTVDDGDITDLGSPALAEEAESIVAEVEPASTSDDEN